jgi:hypothetical protein
MEENKQLIIQTLKADLEELKAISDNDQENGDFYYKEGNNRLASYYYSRYEGSLLAISLLTISIDTIEQYLNKL